MIIEINRNILLLFCFANEYSIVTKNKNNSNSIYMSSITLNSPNNINIGKEEINTMCEYLSVNYLELTEMIFNKILSFYLNINTKTFHLNFSDPPHISYELIILFKRDNNFYTQVFVKNKYPLEFINLNQLQFYEPILPFGYVPGYDVKYPIEKMCLQNNIYTKKYLKTIKKVLLNNFIKVNLPFELIELILSYVIKHTYDENSHFILIDKHNSMNDLVIGKYFHISENVIYVALKV